MDGRLEAAAAAPPGGTDPTAAGHAVYTPGFLRLYDSLVLGVFGPLVWRCPTRLVVAHYARHAGRRHLDVGPGRQCST